MCSLYEQIMLQYPLSLIDPRTCFTTEDLGTTSEMIFSGNNNNLSRDDRQMMTVNLEEIKLLFDRMGFFEGELLTFTTFIQMFYVLISGRRAIFY